MKTIINVSSVTDYSREPPAVFYSNPAVTVLRDPVPPAIISYFVISVCDDCDCDCCCDCRCDCDFDCDCDF